MFCFIIFLNSSHALIGLKEAEVKISGCSKDGNWEISANSAASDKNMLTDKSLSTD